MPDVRSVSSANTASAPSKSLNESIARAARTLNSPLSVNGAKAASAARTAGLVSSIEAGVKVDESIGSLNVTVTDDNTDEVVVAGLGDLQDGQAVTPARRGYP